MASSGAISAARVADLERRLAVAEAARTSAEAARAEAESRLATSEEARARLERMIAQLRRDKFGAASEKSDPDQQHPPHQWRDHRRPAPVREVRAGHALADLRGDGRAHRPALRGREGSPGQRPSRSGLCGICQNYTFTKANPVSDLMGFPMSAAWSPSHSIDNDSGKRQDAKNPFRFWQSKPISCE